MFGLSNKSNRVDELEAEVLALKKRLESYEEVQRFLLRTANGFVEEQNILEQDIFPGNNDQSAPARDDGRINLPGLIYDDPTRTWKAELIDDNGEKRYTYHLHKIAGAIDRWYTEMTLCNFNKVCLEKSKILQYILNTRSKKYIRNKKISILGIDIENNCLNEEELAELKKDSTQTRT